MATYYVATAANGGDDAHNGLYPTDQGGANGPFLTALKAGQTAVAGDRIELRAGTYTGYAAMGFGHNGTAQNHVTVTNYGDGEVILDGQNYTVPTPHGGNGLWNVYGEYWDFSNLTFYHSGEIGLWLRAAHSTATNIHGHYNYSTGVLATADYCEIIDCTCHDNCQENYQMGHPEAWGQGISQCRYPSHGITRGCTCYNNWGEGLSTFESHYMTIEDNIVYNNLTVGLYVSDTEYSVYQRNLSYYTPGNMIQPYCSSQNCMLIGDEVFVPASNHNTIINNLFWGGDRCVAAGGAQFQTALVANNTLVNAFDRIGAAAATLYISGGSSTGGRFANNIILQQDTDVVIATNAGTGITFDHNNWSSTPATSVRGTGDIYSDPLLAQTGSTGPGELAYGYFALTENSPGRGAGAVIAAVSEDYNEFERGSPPDMGALEYREPGGGGDSEARVSVSVRMDWQ